MEPNEGMLGMPMGGGFTPRVTREQYMAAARRLMDKGVKPTPVNIAEEIAIMAGPQKIQGMHQMPDGKMMPNSQMPGRGGPTSEIANRLSEDKTLEARRAAEAKAMKDRNDAFRARRATLPR